MLPAFELKLYLQPRLGYLDTPSVINQLELPYLIETLYSRE